MANLAKMLVTFFIWGMAPLIVIAATDQAVRDINAVIVVTVVMLAAAMGTRAVWTSDALTVEAQTEKSKRVGSRRVRRLMDSLSDDELDELRARLGEDGEVVPLDSLLQTSSAGRKSRE